MYFRAIIPYYHSRGLTVRRPKERVRHLPRVRLHGRVDPECSELTYEERIPKYLIFCCSGRKWV
jgi:hypothetical protein